ncbi:MAG: hypothetical protein U0Z44_20195 [Kouleothrix sp.]
MTTPALASASSAWSTPRRPHQPPGCRRKSANPYVGVGSSAQIALRWQSVFGNTTITIRPRRPATGAINWRGGADPLRIARLAWRLAQRAGQP